MIKLSGFLPNLNVLHGLAIQLNLASVFVIANLDTVDLPIPIAPDKQSNGFAVVTSFGKILFNPSFQKGNITSP